MLHTERDPNRYWSVQFPLGDRVQTYRVALYWNDSRALAQHCAIDESLPAGSDRLYDSRPESVRHLAFWKRLARVERVPTDAMDAVSYAAYVVLCLPLIHSIELECPFALQCAISDAYVLRQRISRRKLEACFAETQARFQQHFLPMVEVCCRNDDCETATLVNEALHRAGATDFVTYDDTRLMIQSHQAPANESPLPW